MYKLYCIDDWYADQVKHWRHDLYAGDQPIDDQPMNDQPIFLPGVKLRAAKEYLKAPDKTDELKKEPGKAQKDGKKKKRKRKKPTREKSLSKPPAAKRLNETMVSQLDVSCFTKTRPIRRLIKAPSIEHAYLAKYARLVFAYQVRVAIRENNAKINFDKICDRERNVRPFCSVSSFNFFFIAGIAFLFRAPFRHFILKRHSG